MTALAANRDTPKMLSPFEMVWEYVGVDSLTFYKGAIIMFDRSDGKVRPAGGTSQSDGWCLGRCMEKVVTGASNTLTVKAESGIFRWVNGESITVASLGLPAYADDDQTVFTTQGSTRSKVGTIVAVDSSGVWVATYPAGV